MKVTDEVRQEFVKAFERGSFPYRIMKISGQAPLMPGALFRVQVSYKDGNRTRLAAGKGTDHFSALEDALAALQQKARSVHTP